jgi:hypothetical protein
VGFYTVYPFIGFAKRTDALLDVLYKVKDNPLLVMTGMEANRATFA